MHMVAWPWGRDYYDFGIVESRFDTLEENACETMDGLVTTDPKELSHEQCVSIYQKSYR